MDVIEAYYGKQTFTFYSLFASVPGKKTWPRTIFLVLNIYLLSITSVHQLIKLAIEKFALEWIIELLPSVSATVVPLLYLPETHFQYETLLSVILNDLREERTAEEEEIKQLYASRARLFVNVFSAVLILATFGIPLLGFTPYLLNWLIPLNESREMRLLADGELFIDQEKYFYLIYSHQCCAVCSVCIIVGVSENMIVIICQHAGGMAAVLGYRLKNITDMKDHKSLDKVDFMQIIRNRLRAYIADHQRLLHFGVLIAAFYDIPVTIILTGSFGAITIALIHVTNPHMLNTTMVIFTVALFFQFFLVSYMGETRLESSNMFLKNTYLVEWDVCSADIRKTLCLVIMRSSKPCKIVASGIYVLSIENFMSVVQTMTSFYMVLRQTV